MIQHWYKWDIPYYNQYCRLLLLNMKFSDHQQQITHWPHLTYHDHWGILATHEQLFLPHTCINAGMYALLNYVEYQQECDDWGEHLWHPIVLESVIPTTQPMNRPKLIKSLDTIFYWGTPVIQAALHQHLQHWENTSCFTTLPQNCPMHTKMTLSRAFDAHQHGARIVSHMLNTLCGEIVGDFSLFWWWKSWSCVKKGHFIETNVLFSALPPHMSAVPGVSHM